MELTEVQGPRRYKKIQLSPGSHTLDMLILGKQPAFLEEAQLGHTDRRLEEALEERG